MAQAACHPQQKKADGNCCAAGKFYEFKTDSCVAVGPPECAEVIFNNPEKCVPKWCWDWQDKDKNPCTAWSEGCETAGRLCTDEEIAGGGGCPAGTFPVGDKAGDCAPAGFFPGSGVPRDWQGDLKSLPDVPPLAEVIAPGVPTLTTLSDANNTFFCVDEKSGEQRFCTEVELKTCQRGANGEMPDPKKCAYVGARWPTVCPPGFIVDAQANVIEGEVAPCVPDPADCPADPWPDVKAATAVLYVDAGGGSDGNDGSKVKPLKSIGKALKAAASGATIAVTDGEYDESLSIIKPVVIRGRCGDKVHIYGHDNVPVINVKSSKQAGQVLVSGLCLGGDGSGVEVAEGAKVELQRVFIGSVFDLGVLLLGNGAELDAQQVVIADTFANPGDGSLGRGLDMEGGSLATLLDVRISGNHELGIFVGDNGTSLNATNLMVDDTLPRKFDLKLGGGLDIEKGGKVTLKNARFSANRNAGIFVAGAGSALEASQLLVDATLSRDADDKSGVGVVAIQGAKVVLHSARLTGNHLAGAYATDAATLVEATQLLVDGNLAQETDKKGGHGINALDGATVALQEARITGNREGGLAISGVGASVNASQLLVDNTLSRQTDLLAGRGINVQKGAHATLTGVRLSHNRELGLAVHGTATTCEATHLVVDGTQAREDPQQMDAGVGVMVRTSAKLTLVDARISSNRVVGLFVGDAGSVLHATRLVVDATLPRLSDGDVGGGITVVDQAVAILLDVRISKNRYLGLGLEDVDYAGGTLVRAARILVDGTQTSSYGGLNQGGRGVNAQNPTSVELSASRLIANSEYGASASNHGALRFVGVVISDTATSGVEKTRGGGLSATVNCTMTLDACLVADNVLTGIGQFYGSLQARRVVVNDTKAGTMLNLFDDLVDKTYAHGVVLYKVEAATVDQCLLIGNQSTGILAQSAAGLKIGRTLVNGSAGLYGVDLQDSKDTVENDNAIFGAAQKDHATDAGLPLPAPPKPVKTLPAPGP